MKSLKSLVIACFLLTFINVTPQANEQNLNLRNSQTNTNSELSTIPNMRFVDNGLNGVEFEYRFNGISLKTISENSETYQISRIEGFSLLSEIGKPALPAHTDIIAVPEDASINIIIQNADYNTQSNYKIYPVQEGEIDVVDAKKPPFTIDQACYSSNEFYPKDIVRIKEIQKYRGVQLAMIEICPVQYNPVTKKLRIYSTVEYKIEFTGGNKSYQKFSTENSASANQMLKNYVLNGKSIPKANVNTSKSTNRADYIIITKDTYLAAADTLAKWKQQLGYEVEVVSASSWTAAMVKDSIHYRYQNWTPKPDYFVIIGDHGDVPGEMHLAPSNASFATDLYYACMDGTGDYVPEMAHGRISVTSASEALNVVQKIVNYERNPITDATFYSNATGFGEFQDDNNDGYADRRFTHTLEDFRDYLTTKGYTVHREYYTPSSANPTNYNNGYYSDGQAIPSVLLKSNGFNWISDNGVGYVHSNFNSGRFLALHRGHGYTGGWGWCHPFFVSHSYYHNIDDMTNGDKLPVIISVDCHSGEFQTANCFSENMLRKQNGGAVGVIAAAYYSYSGPNDGFATGVVDAIWSNPGLVPDFGAGGVTNPSLTSHSDIVTMGDAMNQGLIRMMEVWNGSATQYEYTHELFHYFGDPAMRLWTSSPVTISATIQDTLPRLANSIDITSSTCTDGLATLFFEGELMGSVQLVNGSGTINFTALDSGQAIVTISKHNYRPYIKKVYINNVVLPIPPAQQAKNIQFTNPDSKSTSITISWENGDGDFRLVKINTENSFADPVDGNEYSGNPDYLGIGEQVVYSGNGSEVTVNKLENGITYWVRVYEYNNSGEFTKYTTTTEVNNPANPIEGGGALPITLLSFTGQRNINSVTLNWSTATEINNDNFAIERSTNGISYVEISTLPGAGTSFVTNSYSFDDASAPNVDCIYRLKQTDFDGNTNFTESIIVAAKKQAGTISVYPTNNTIKVSLGGSVNGPVSFSLFDINGKGVYNKSIESTDLQMNCFEYNTNNLSKGVYVVTVTNNNQVYSEKIKINN
jgi:hypothetical protein